MTTITARAVEYLADGVPMIGHLALPAGTDRCPADNAGLAHWCSVPRDGRRPAELRTRNTTPR